ncbi:MAG: HAD-IC family P-type ATPase, partial [Chloroflexota bacterium]|nr:HAD-IC family P-type ATPase [Chloroflexota bacterium]
MSEPPKWHALPADEVLRVLDTDGHGLSSGEAARRLARFGANELEQERPTPAWIILLGQLRGPLIAILIAAALVTLALGEFIDAAVIAAALTLNTVIGFTQERRAEEAVRALRRLASPSARVVRDGRDQVIPSRELVPGDIVLLESGVRVPADLRVLAATALAVDESLLTGESVPVQKSTAPVLPETPLADRTCMAYAGTIVTSGRGRGVVVATGRATEVGSIAEAMREAAKLETPLHERLRSLSRLILAAVAAGGLLTFALGLAVGESATHLFTTAVGLAVAVVPEGLPVVFTIALALGVRRMARRNAIVRHLPAVETLGSITAIATDKTGTLTEN